MIRIPYTCAIGSVLYAMVFSRPDIAYVVSLVSRYMSYPGNGQRGTKVAVEVFKRYF